MCAIATRQHTYGHCTKPGACFNAQRTRDSATTTAGALTC